MKRKVKVNPKSLKNLAPKIKPGQRLNQNRTHNVGATIRMWMNALSQGDKSEDDLMTLARDRRCPVAKRAAAQQLIRMVTVGDLADMESALDGEQSLRDLRTSGVNTQVIKKAKKRIMRSPDGEKIGEEIEIELKDTAGQEFDRVVDHTDGKAIQRQEISGAGGEPIKALVGIDVDKV